MPTHGVLAVSTIMTVHLEVWLVTVLIDFKFCVRNVDGRSCGTGLIYVIDFVYMKFGSAPW
ncbi:hypothetical protein Pint_01590 [Pistacia integerrima]|uniref:Uncharacterized protein n=1 Tax=Pistacia integerrima TaxID=434235 RepID=A0ACC0ZL51_9ROSI|nr:hypothetical protein Pint_01590 [Pistacia integerrima]